MNVDEIVWMVGGSVEILCVESQIFPPWASLLVASLRCSPLLCAWRHSAGSIERKIDTNLCICFARLGINEFGMSSGEKVRASHLLVKHEGSRRPASWKDPDGKVIRKTSRDDAVAKLRGFKTQIESGQATLADLAKNDSDCSSAKRGGDLG